MALICLFLAGLYTHYTIQISAKVPFPSAPAGVAGMFLLWRRRDQIKSAAFGGFLALVLLYLLSILAATDIRFLPRRTNGLVQLTYSLTIGYLHSAAPQFGCRTIRSPCMLAAGLFSSLSPDHGIAKIGAGRSFPLD